MIKMIIKYDQKRHHINGEDGPFKKIKNIVTFIFQNFEINNIMVFSLFVQN